MPAEQCQPKYSKVYFNVPYDDRDEAKEYKLRWDPELRHWYGWKMGDEQILPKNLFNKWRLPKEEVQELRKKAYDAWKAKPNPQVFFVSSCSFV